MEKILFVYNADSGILNGLKDLIHKNVSPETYACRLCAVTYNNLGMIPEWRKFLQGLGRDVEFLHRDELELRFSMKAIPLPAAFIHCKNTGTRLWLDADAMNRCRTLEDLKQLVMRNIPG